MPKYTYTGNRRAGDTTAALKVSGGAIVKLGESVEISEQEYANLSQNFEFTLAGQSTIPKTEVKVENTATSVEPVVALPKSGPQGTINVKPSDDVDRPSEG